MQSSTSSTSSSSNKIPSLFEIPSPFNLDSVKLLMLKKEQQLARKRANKKNRRKREREAIRAFKMASSKENPQTSAETTVNSPTTIADGQTIRALDVAPTSSVVQVTKPVLEVEKPPVKKAVLGAHDFNMELIEIYDEVDPIVNIADVIEIDDDVDPLADMQNKGNEQETVLDVNGQVVGTIEYLNDDPSYSQANTIEMCTQFQLKHLPDINNDDLMIYDNEFIAPVAKKPRLNKSDIGGALDVGASTTSSVVQVTKPVLEVEKPPVKKAVLTHANKLPTKPRGRPKKEFPGKGVNKKTADKELPKKKSKKPKSMVQVQADEEIVKFLKEAEQKLCDWGITIKGDDPKQHKGLHSIVNLDELSSEIKFIQEVKIEHVLNSVFDRFTFEKEEDGIVKVLKVGSMYSHFSRDQTTGLLKIYSNKHKDYQVDLHNIIGFYKLDQKCMNTIERIYVQGNRIFCLGNVSDDVGNLGNLDQGRNSDVRILYAVPVSKDFREAIAKLVRFNHVGFDNNIEYFSKQFVSMSVLERIGKRCICCMPCNATFRYKHDHLNRNEIYDNIADISDMDELPGSERRLVPQAIKEIFEVETYQQALNKTIGLVTEKVAQYGNLLTSNRIKVFSDKPWFKYQDYLHFYKSLHEVDTFYVMSYLLREYQDSDSTYCCTIGICADASMRVSKASDLQKHFVEKHFVEFSCAEFIDLVMQYIREEQQNEATQQNEGTQQNEAT